MSSIRANSVSASSLNTLSKRNMYKNQTANRLISSVINGTTNEWTCSDFEHWGVEELSMFLKLRHDMVHMLVSKVMGAPSKERKMHEVLKLEPKISLKETWDKISNQTPDMVVDIDGVIHVFDIAVSNDPIKASARKQSKYSLIMSYLKQMSVPSELMPLPFNETGEDAVEVMDFIHRWNVLPEDTFKEVVQSVRNVLINCNILYGTFTECDRSSEIREELDGQTRTALEIKTTRSSVTERLSRCKRHPFGHYSYEELFTDERFKTFFTKEITEDDHELMHDIVDEALRRFKPTLDLFKSIDTPGRDIEDFKKEMLADTHERYKDNKRVFIFPMFTDNYTPRKVDSRYERTKQILEMVCSQFSMEKNQSEFEICDSLLAGFEGMGLDEIENYNGEGSKLMSERELKVDRKGQIRVRVGNIRGMISSDTEFTMAQNGVGRKKYASKWNHHTTDNDLRYRRNVCREISQSEDTLVHPIDVDNEDIETFFRWCMSHRKIDHEMCYHDTYTSKFMKEEVENLDGKLNSTRGVQWVKYCQEVVREISLNATRRRDKSRYLVSLMSDAKTLIVLAPGNKLKTDTLIWFKLYSVSSRSDIQRVFTKVYGSNKVWSTEWRSLKIDKIEGWIRSVDTIKMAFSSLVETNTVNSVRNAIDFELTTDSLAIMIGHYMEMKRETSSTMQNARYLVMKAISIKKTLSEPLEKFKVPYRSRFNIFLLNRLLEGCQEISKVKTASLLENPWEFDEYGNVVDKDIVLNDTLVRPFSRSLSGGLIKCDYKVIILEMYYHMLFSKNEGEKANDALSIMKKITKEEVKLRADYDFDLGSDIGELKSEEHSQNFTGLPKKGSSLREFNKLILSSKFKSHRFSAHAITLGTKLSMIHKHANYKNGALYPEITKSRHLSKSLSEFGTFKASATNVKKRCNVDLLDEAVQSMADRTKCLTNLVETLNNKGYDTFQEFVKNEVEWFEVQIQLFKKRQIGGAREIIILDIVSRIVINWSESMARAFCENDRREMLTQGTTKFKVISDELKALMRGNKRRRTFNYNNNADMTTWCQQFMPIQFFYFWAPFHEQMGDALNTIAHIMIAHSEKFMEFPSELVSLTHKNPDYIPKDPEYNELNKCIKRGNLGFINFTNMGQGILHYGSSALHLSLLSLVEQCIKICNSVLVNQTRLFQNLKFKVDLFACASSDDRLSIYFISDERSNSENMNKTLVAFVMSIIQTIELLCETLFTVKKSTSKSSDTILVSEFNSSFMALFNSYTPLLKFAIKSVPVPDTRSFGKMVSECFSSVQQLRKNGATSFLCNYAHMLNKNFCENLYHTKRGQVNDLTLLSNGSDLKDLPYDLGVYPVMHEDIAEISGPESWNFLCWERGSTLGRKILSVIYLADTEPDASDFAQADDLGELESPRRVRFEITMGVSHRLKTEKKRLGINEMGIENLIHENPLLTLSKAKTCRDVVSKTLIKMFMPGAREAFRFTNAALFYARTSALTTGKVFKLARIDNVDDEGDFRRYTYSEMINEIINYDLKELKMDDVGSIMESIIVNWRGIRRVMEVVKTVVKTEAGFLGKRPLRAVEVRTKDLGFRITNDVPKILSYLWGLDEDLVVDRDLLRDVELIKNEFPYIESSIEATMDNLNIGDTDSRLKRFRLASELVARFGKKSDTDKWYLYGRKTMSIQDTILLLMTQNSIPGKRFSVKEGNSLAGVSDSVEACNLVMNWLLFKCRKNSDPNSNFSREEFNSLLKKRFINKHSPTIEDLLIANMDDLFTKHHDENLRIPIAHYLNHTGNRSKMIDLLNKTSLVKHRWLTSQVKKNGKWQGKYSLLLSTEDVYIIFRGRGPGVFPMGSPEIWGNPSNRRAIAKIMKRASSLLSDDNEGSKRFYDELKKAKAHKVDEGGYLHDLDTQGRLDRRDFKIYHDLENGNLGEALYKWEGDYSFKLSKYRAKIELKYNPEMWFSYSSLTGYSRYQLYHKTYIGEESGSLYDLIKSTPDKSRYLTMKLHSDDGRFTLYESLVNYGIFKINFSLQNMTEEEKRSVMVSSDGYGYLDDELHVEGTKSEWKWMKRVVMGNNKELTRPLGTSYDNLSNVTADVDGDQGPIDYENLDIEGILGDFVQESELDQGTLLAATQIVKENLEDPLEGLEFDFITDVDFDLGQKWRPVIRNTVAFSEIERIHSLPQRIFFNRFHKNVSITSEEQLKGFYYKWINKINFTMPKREHESILYHSELLNFLVQACRKLKMDPSLFINHEKGTLNTLDEMLPDDPVGRNKMRVELMGYERFISERNFPSGVDLLELIGLYEDPSVLRVTEPLMKKRKVLSAAESTERIFGALKSLKKEEALGDKLIIKWAEWVERELSEFKHYMSDDYMRNLIYSNIGISIVERITSDDPNSFVRMLNIENKDELLNFLSTFSFLDGLSDYNKLKSLERYTRIAPGWDDYEFED